MYVTEMAYILETGARKETDCGKTLFFSSVEVLKGEENREAIESRVKVDFNKVYPASRGFVDQYYVITEEEAA